MAASEEIRKRLREGGQAPPSPIKPSQAIREKIKAEKPEPRLPVSESIRRKIDKNPESLYERYNQGDTELDRNQLKTVFDKQREQPLVEQAAETAKVFFPRLLEIGGQLVKGTAKFTKEAAIDQVAANPAGALSDIVGLPVDAVAEGINKFSTALGGDRVYETQYGPGQSRPIGGSKFFHPWDRNAKQQKEAAEAELALRSVASGIGQDLEETAGSAVKFYNYGSALTDRLQEAVGTKTEKESFDDFVTRTYMTQEAQARAKENPDRAAALLAENPLVRPIIAGVSALQGVELSPEELDAAQEDYKQAVLAKSIIPDEDMSLVGEIINPVGLPARLVKPVSKAIEKPFQKGADLTAKALTKTVKGVHPIEGLGIGLEKASEFSRKSGRKLSEVLTGDPDTVIKEISLIPQVPTYLPGKILKTTGRLLRDAGRQIDAQGMRGRKGLAERLGGDAASGEFSRRFFGTTKGGLMRARSADWIGRYSGAVARSGTSGAALNVMLGLPEIENPTQLGQSLGTGVAIGTFMGSDPFGRVGALLDPTTDFATRVDRVLTPDAGARRADEDADIARFMALADESTKAKVRSFSDVNARIATLDEQIRQFQIYRDSTENPRNWKFWQDQMNTLIGHRNLLDKNKNNKQFTAEVERQVALDFADALEQLKAIGNQSGIGSPSLKILDDSNAEEEIRKIWGKTLTDAEFFREQLTGKPTLEPNEAELLQKANQTIQAFEDLIEQSKTARGFAIHRNLYLNSPAHLTPANLDSPIVALNGNLLSHLGREGFNPGHTLRHESFHVLRQLKEVRDALGVEQVEQQMFGRKIKDESGRVIAEIPGVYTEDDVFRYGQNYAARMGGQSFIDQFDSLEKFYAYIREEMLSENYATSGNIKGGLRAATDSTGQALVDWIEAKTRNGSLKQLKEVLRQRGIIFNNRGEFSAILGAKIDPESSALMRRVQRLLRDEIGAYTFETDGLNPDGTEKVRDEGDIPWAAVMANPALQEQYIMDERFVKDQVLAVYDDAGNKVSEVVLPDGVQVDPYIAQYYVKNGKIVDEAGNEIILGQPVNLSALPDGSRVQADFKIRRNPDGTPVVISPREANARATKRGKMIYDAIINAPEDGMPKMRDQDDNGVLTGVMSPAQLQAVLNLPNSIVPARLKRIIAAGNAMLERKDGTRAIIDYQAVYRGGKARSLAPRVRDIVPLSWRISKKQNFLFTSISVSRMFDKLNVWSSRFPENLTLWGGDTFKFWQDLLKVLANHNAGLTADGKNSSGQYVGEVLDVDNAIAELKKNRINDFFNLFDKGTESMNPMRTKIKAKRGQDSPDRLIMSARVDRINHFEESASQKLPVDYGKMKVNFMPNLGYSIPSDPRTLMADFYLINYLSGFSNVPYQEALVGLSEESLARYSGENPEAIDFLRAEDYRGAIKVTQDRLQTFLKEHLLDQVFFSLSAEIRHAIKRNQNPDIYGPIMNQYIKYFSAYDSPSQYQGRKPDVPEYFESSEGVRKKSWQATTRALEKFSGKEFAKARRKDLALEMAKVFREGIWASGYGGEKWAQIAEAFVLLHYANTPEKIAFAIDKVYDLQHNTNTVFNKIEKYAKDGGYRWVMEMLDFKYHLKNPRELLPLVSSDLKKLALPILKDFGNVAAPTKEYLEKIAIGEVGPEAVKELRERIKKIKPGPSIYSHIGVNAPKESGRDFSTELSNWLQSQLTSYAPKKSEIITREDGTQYAVDVKPPKAFIELAQLLIAEKMDPRLTRASIPKDIQQIFEDAKNQKQAQAQTKIDPQAYSFSNPNEPQTTSAGVKVTDKEIFEAVHNIVYGTQRSVKFGDYTFSLQPENGYDPMGNPYSSSQLVAIDKDGAVEDEVSPSEQDLDPTLLGDWDDIVSLYYEFIKKSLGIPKKQPFSDSYLDYISDTLMNNSVGQTLEFEASLPTGMAYYRATLADVLSKSGNNGIRVVSISKKKGNDFEKLFEVNGSTAAELKEQIKINFRSLNAAETKISKPSKVDAYLNAVNAVETDAPASQKDLPPKLKFLENYTLGTNKKAKGLNLLKDLTERLAAVFELKEKTGTPYYISDINKVVDVWETVNWQANSNKLSSKEKDALYAYAYDYVSKLASPFNPKSKTEAPTSSPKLTKNLLPSSLEKWKDDAKHMLMDKYWDPALKGYFGGQYSMDDLTPLLNAIVNFNTGEIAIDAAAMTFDPKKIIKDSAIKTPWQHGKIIGFIEFALSKALNIEKSQDTKAMTGEEWKAKWKKFGYLPDATADAYLDAILNPETGEVAKSLQVVLNKVHANPSYTEKEFSGKQPLTHAWLKKAWQDAFDKPLVGGPAEASSTSEEPNLNGLMLPARPLFTAQFGLKPYAITNPFESITGQVLDVDPVSYWQSKGVHPDAVYNAIQKFKNENPEEFAKVPDSLVQGSIKTYAANQPVFGTTDPYVYHLTSNDPETLGSISAHGLWPSKRGYSGPGIYFGNTPENTQVYDDLDSETSALLRIKKDALLNAFGKYSSKNNTTGLQFDDYTGEIYLDVNYMQGLESIPVEWIEYKNDQGNWVSLADNPLNKSLQEPIGEKEVYQLETDDGNSFATDDLFSFTDAYGSKNNILQYWKASAAWPPGASQEDKSLLVDAWKFKIFSRIKAALGDAKTQTDFASFSSAYGNEILNIHEEAWELLENISPSSFQNALDLATMQDLNSIIQATSFEPELYQEYLQWSKPGGAKNAPASFMPSEEYGLESGEEAESRLTPKILYNLYYISTEGDPGNEYGRSLQNEYVSKYKNLYLDVFSDLVKNQINKYIGRGRVDPFVTKEALQNAKSASQLDELMRGTYRSDMRRRNDVWNLVTEFLKGLESAQTKDQRLFYMDRLNNAIHNTNELLFSKFSNASRLMEAFNLIANARDVRAYSRNVDKDLRMATTFGGPPASFMPSILDRVGLTPEHLQNLNKALQDGDRLKSMVNQFVKTGNEEDFTAIVIDPVFSALFEENRLPLPSQELSSWLKALRSFVISKDASDIKRARSSITRILNNPTSFNTKEIAEIISEYVNEGRLSHELWRIEGAAPYTGDPVESFRGIALNGPLIEGLKVGDTIEIDSPGYESWSTDPKVAVRFATKVSNTGMDSFSSTMQWLRNRAQAEKENRKGLPGDYGLVLSTTLDSDSVAIDVSQLNSDSRYINESELIARPGKKLVTIAAIYRDQGEDSTPEIVERSVYEDRDITITLDSEAVENKIRGSLHRNSLYSQLDYEERSRQSERIGKAFTSGNSTEVIEMLGKVFKADGIDADISKIEGSDAFKIRVKSTNPLNVHRYFGKGESLERVAQGIPQFMPTQAALNRTKKNLPKYKVDKPTDEQLEVYEAARVMIRLPNGKAIGDADIYLQDSPSTLIIGRTWVEEKYRGRGYGQALYLEIAKIAKQLKKKYLYSHTVSEDASRVRKKLFDEKPLKFGNYSRGKWKKSGDEMRSLVAPNISYMPAWSANQLAERSEITTIPDEFKEEPLRPRFVYRLESIEGDPEKHELVDTGGFTFFTTSPEAAAALALNFANDGYRPTSENFSIYRYSLPKDADIQRDHTLFNLDKMTSGQARVAAVRNAHKAMGLPLDAYRYVPAGEIAGTTGKQIEFPENPDLMKIYRAIRRGGRMGGIQFMPGSPMRSAAIKIGDKVFEESIHPLAQEVAWLDSGIQKMFSDEDQFYRVMQNADLKDQMDYTSMTFGEEPNANPTLEELPAGVPPITFGFVGKDGKFYSRREAMQIVYSDYEQYGLDRQPVGPLFTEDLPTPMSRVQFMPGSSQVDSGLADVALANTDRGPLSGASFMPGYNPRYSNDDGSFNREAWLNDRRRAEELLRRRGVYRSSVTEEEWEEMVRAEMRGVRRQSWL